MNRRRFLTVLIGAALAPRVVAKALEREKLPPPPPPPVADFTRVVVPMCFYSHVRRVTLTQSFEEEFIKPYSAEDAAVTQRWADALADDIVFGEER